jgi:2-polyprenyl-6-methoxyphenol hydroxylase-like FAD-dependent oxidoreductase
MNIAISGAGVAGCALAFWLHRTGHQPTLIEEATSFRDGGYIIDFWGVGYAVAERMGLLPQIHKAGYQVREVRFVDAGGHRIGGFDVGVFRWMLGDRFTSLPRGDLARLIYGAVEDRVETIFGTSISRLENRADGVRVFLGAQQRDFDLVIGADGLHSNVRQLAFGGNARSERFLGYYVAAFEARGYRRRDELVFVSRGLPGRQISRFTLRGDRTLFLFVFAAEHLVSPEPCGIAARKAAIHQVFAKAEWEWPGIEEALNAANDLYFDSVSQVVMDRWSSGRVCMIGDAAGCVSLLAGEGTGLAITEAYVLAGELHAAKGDPATAFAAYEHKLRSLIERKQKSARNFASSFAPRTAAGLWFRNQMTKLMDIPFVAEALIGADIRDGFDLPDYGI